LSLKSDKRSVTSQEHLYTYVILSGSFIFRMNNISDKELYRFQTKVVDIIKTTYFMFEDFFPVVVLSFEIM